MASRAIHPGEHLAEELDALEISRGGFRPSPAVTLRSAAPVQTNGRHPTLSKTTHSPAANASRPR
jgi:hypothetical protein